MGLREGAGQSVTYTNNSSSNPKLPLPLVRALNFFFFFSNFERRFPGTMASFQTFPRKGVALNFAFSPTPTSVTLASPGFLFFKLSSLRGEAEITPFRAVAREL